MISPSFDEFKNLSRSGNLIALRLDLPSDLETPVSAFLKLEAREPCAFLLESAEQQERIGRYSFLGFDPDLILTPGDRGSPADLLSVMRKRLSSCRLANPEGLPNFAGGFVGFLGYENVRFFERVSLRKKPGLGIDETVFFLIKDFIIFDHFRKTLSIVSIAENKSKSGTALKGIYQKGVRKIRALEAKLARNLPPQKKRKTDPRRFRFASNLSRQEFEKSLGRIKEYIRAGDCIQVVFSQRFSLGQVRDDFDVYRMLHSINPSPYMFYFRYGSLRLIGSSPEVLVKKTGRLAEVRPIAGTRPRGESTSRDIQLEENLRHSVKEMAEHLMLVDLGRNDLGRVCEFNSIKVSDFARVERYSHVMHLVSSVQGTLKRGKDAFDLLRATFPAGTVTGAPKIRAMEIIDELEPEKRGPYAGSLGYFSFNHDMDMCITIRTIVVKGNQAYVQAGAGVVYDSKPQREYEETVNKAKALVQAVQSNHRVRT